VNEERNAEIERLLMQGMKPCEVAEKMGASSRTVSTINKGIIDKMAKDFTEFADYTDGGEAA
jgi:DNA-binding NarL/FixJ family response regulator